MLKKYGILALFVAITIAASSNSEAALRKVVVEDHTGAWCQFCPRGTETLRSLSEEFGNYFIPVQIHNGDRMVNEDQQALAQAIQLGGYPGGTVDRAYRGQGTGDNTWDPRTRERMAKYVPLDVDVEYSINGGMLEATVTVTADADYDEQFAVNLIVLEDGVTGNGQGWDQVNFFSGRAGYEDNPYYNKPNPVPNYVHDNVAWKYVGGLWGVSEDTPMSMSAGDTYQKTFTWSLSEEPRIQNPSNIWVVGLAQELNQGEFINAEMAGKEGIEEKEPITFTASLEGEEYLINPAGNQLVKTFEITNNSNKAVDVTLSSENSVLPNNWSVELSQNAGTIDANSSITVEATLNDGGGAAGFGIVRLDVSPNTDLTENEFSVPAFASFGSLSDNTKNLFLYGLSQNPNGQLQGLQSTTGFLTDIALIPLNNNIIDSYDFSFVETAYLEINDDNAPGFSGSAFDSYRDQIRSMVDAGVDVFISGATNLLAAFNSQYGGESSQNTKDFYREFLGVELGPFLQLVNQQGQLSQLPVTGNNDLAGITATVNGGFSQQTPFFDRYMDFISPVQGSEVVNLGYVNGLQQNGQPIPPDGAIAIAGIEKENARVALASFSFEAAGPANQKQQMMDAIYEWLKGEAQAGSPLISVTNVLDFGVVEKETTEQIEIENKGTAPLFLELIRIQNDDNGAFLFDDTTFPIDGIEPGSSAMIEVTYLANVDGVSTADLVIVSDDGENDATVALSGEKMVSSVSNEIENVLTINAVPNTFDAQTNLNINIEGSEFVNINLVDINGNAVSNIYNGTLSGSTTQVVERGNLSAGKYFIVANVDGQIARVPVIIK